MQQVALFFGFPVDERYAAALEKLDPKIYNLYVGKGNSNYLDEVTYRGQRYLGRPLETLVDSAMLELLQLNIYSLLNKLVPTFPYEEVPLCLVPLMR